MGPARIASMVPGSCGPAGRMHEKSNEGREMRHAAPGGQLFSLHTTEAVPGMAPGTSVAAPPPAAALLLSRPLRHPRAESPPRRPPARPCRRTRSSSTARGTKRPPVASLKYTLMRSSCRSLSPTYMPVGSTPCSSQMTCAQASPRVCEAPGVVLAGGSGPAGLIAGSCARPRLHPPPRTWPRPGCCTGAHNWHVGLAEGAVRSAAGDPSHPQPLNLMEQRFAAKRQLAQPCPGLGPRRTYPHWPTCRAARSGAAISRLAGGVVGASPGAPRTLKAQALAHGRGPGPAGKR